MAEIPEVQQYLTRVAQREQRVSSLQAQLESQGEQLQSEASQVSQSAAASQRRTGSLARPTVQKLQQQSQRLQERQQEFTRAQEEAQRVVEQENIEVQQAYEQAVKAQLDEQRRQQELAQRFERGEVTAGEFEQAFKDQYTTSDAATAAYYDYLISSGKNLTDAERFDRALIAKISRSGEPKQPKLKTQKVIQQEEKLLIEGSAAIGGFTSVTGQNVFITAEKGAFAQAPASFEEPKQFASKEQARFEKEIKGFKDALPVSFVKGRVQGARFTPTTIQPVTAPEKVELEKINIPAMLPFTPETDFRIRTQARQGEPELFNVQEAQRRALEAIAPEINLTPRVSQLNLIRQALGQRPLSQSAAPLPGVRTRVRVILPFGAREIAVAGLSGFISGGTEERAVFEAKRAFGDTPEVETATRVGLTIASIAVSAKAVGTFEKRFLQPSSVEFALRGSRKQIVGVPGSGKGVISARSEGTLRLDYTPKQLERFVGPSGTPYSIRPLFVRQKPVEVLSEFSVRTIPKQVGRRGEIDPVVEQLRKILSTRVQRKLSEVPIALSRDSAVKAEAAATKDILKEELRKRIFEVKQIGIIRVDGKEIPFGVTSLQETTRLKGITKVIQDQLELEYLRFRAGEIVVSGSGGKVKRVVREGELIGRDITQQEKNILQKNVIGSGQFRQVGASKVTVTAGKRTGLQIVKARVKAETGFPDPRGPTLTVKERVITVGPKGTAVEMAAERAAVQKKLNELIVKRKEITSDPFRRLESAKRLEQSILKLAKRQTEIVTGRKLSEKQFASILEKRRETFSQLSPAEVQPKGIPTAQFNRITFGQRTKVVSKKLEPFVRPPSIRPKQSLQDALFQLAKEQREQSLGRKLSDKEFIEITKKLNIPAGVRPTPPKPPKQTLTESLKKLVEREKSKQQPASFKLFEVPRSERALARSPYYIPPVKDQAGRFYKSTTKAFTPVRPVQFTEVTPYVPPKGITPESTIEFTPIGRVQSFIGIFPKGTKVKDILQIGEQSQPIKNISLISGLPRKQLVKQLGELPVKRLDAPLVEQARRIFTGRGEVSRFDPELFGTGRPGIQISPVVFGKEFRQSAFVHEFVHTGQYYAGQLRQKTTGLPFSQYLQVPTERQALAVQQQFLASKGKSLSQRILEVSGAGDVRNIFPKELPLPGFPRQAQSIQGKVSSDIAFFQRKYAQSFRNIEVARTIPAIPKPSATPSKIKPTTRGTTKGLFVPATTFNQAVVQRVTGAITPSISKGALGVIGALQLRPGPRLLRPAIVSTPSVRARSLPLSRAQSIPISQFITSPETQPISIPERIPLTEPITRPITSPVTTPITTPGTTPTTVPATIPTTIPITTPITTPISIPISTPVTTPLGFPILPPRPTTTVPSAPEDQDRKPSRIAQGYNVYVKVKKSGKKQFIQVDKKGTSLSKIDAERFGENVTDQALEASYYVRPSKKPLAQLRGLPDVSYKFRVSKERISKTIPVLVEKETYRLDTQTEVKRIQAARVAARLRKNIIKPGRSTTRRTFSVI